MKPFLHKLSALKITLFLILVVILLTPVSLIAAQTGGDYEITRWTLGGQTNSGSGYSLTGDVNQTEPAPALTGSGYTLVGGYWAGAMSTQTSLYLPVILRQ
jgi:hypothetical protein